MVKRLIYEATQVAVKPHDVVVNTELGTVIVHNVRAPRKHSGFGRVTLELSDGRVLDYTPDVIKAKWINR